MVSPLKNPDLSLHNFLLVMSHWGFLFGLVLVTLIDCYRHNFLVCTPRVLMMISGGG